MANNLFGTDGIRTQFGKDPLTPKGLMQLGEAVAQWAQKTYSNEPSILLAHDTRLSCSFVKSAFKAGALLYPVKLTDAGILPSPALALLLQNLKNIDLGIIISASHNPFYDNGIKIVGKNGKISKKDEEHITYLFESKSSTTDLKSLGTDIHKPLKNEYITYLNYLPDHFLKNKKIVIDCANGATYHCAPRIFKKFGAEIITLYNKPNGININGQCGSLYPNNLQKAVLKHKADIGFAFDGDGDRVIAINRFGDIKDGDDILALLLELPIYSSMKTIVGTVMTNGGLELYLKQKNKKLIRTSVGDRYIFEELKKNNLLIGGEASGHIILRDHCYTGDGIFTALRLLQALELSSNWYMKTFTKFPQLLTAIHVSAKKDLNKEPFFEIISANKKKLNQGRVLVRYSGTEPVLRIMVEDNDWDNAQKICIALSKQLREKLAY